MVLCDYSRRLVKAISHAYIYLLPNRTKSDHALRKDINTMGGLPSITEIPWGPYFDREDFRKIITDMKQQEEYVNAPLVPVYEVLIHSFIHPKDSSNPASISTGVLTGGDPLWAFTVGEQYGHGELYYFVYDTKVIDHREDRTWVVEHKDIVLVKAQIAVEGYKPELKDMLRSAIRIFGGYTKFTPAMIHHACILLN